MISGKKGEVDYEEFDSIWDALGFSGAESANLEMRSDLIISLSKIIADNQWTQVEAAKRCGVSQPRMNDLIRGKIDKFSLDSLVNIAMALGHRVNLTLEAA